MTKAKNTPFPSYKNNKPYIDPIKDFFEELGAQDACFQLQELSIVHMEETANASNTPIENYISGLFMAHKIPHGSHKLSELRLLAYRTFISNTYTIFEKTIKLCNSFYRENRNLEWITTLPGGAALHPLEQLLKNCTHTEKIQLTQPPEFYLIEYYRRIRIASAHPNQKTEAEAIDAYNKITAHHLLHFSQYKYIVNAPNPPSRLNFHDFMLYTRAIKYYINILNDVCA